VKARASERAAFDCFGGVNLGGTPARLSRGRTTRASVCPEYPIGKKNNPLCTIFGRTSQACGGS
jgi:hypothetical protein